ncbi:type VII secretion target [Saccharothrix syringae]|uniref:type VII secretion target n=1 Tax=Saccharothrix syringae TaxID=103733 RepID=UPI000525FEC2|nr:type VII secretion target [Saccharothrix syringae]
MSGFEVEARQLRRFAGDQEGRQGEISAVADGVAGINLGADTFGVLLQFFADGAQEAAAQTAEAIRRLAEANGEAASDTVATAAQYEDVEDGNQQRFGGGA